MLIAEERNSLYKYGQNWDIRSSVLLRSLFLQLTDVSGRSNYPFFSCKAVQEESLECFDWFSEKVKKPVKL